jgi:hypothetical protein
MPASPRRWRTCPRPPERQAASAASRAPSSARRPTKGAARSASAAGPSRRQQRTARRTPWPAARRAGRNPSGPPAPPAPRRRRGSRRGGGVGQARREVHGLAGDRVLAVRLAPGAARHHLAARQADVRLSGRPIPAARGGTASRMARAARAARSASLPCATGRAEDRHDAVADVLVHAAAVLLHDPVGAPEEAPSSACVLLRPELAAQRREARQVGEEHGHLPPLASPWRAAPARSPDRAAASRRRGRPQGRDGPEDLLAVARAGRREGEEVGVRQVRQHVGVHRVLAERRRVLASPSQLSHAATSTRPSLPCLRTPRL